MNAADILDKLALATTAAAAPALTTLVSLAAAHDGSLVAASCFGVFAIATSAFAIVITLKA